jgi:hypothetical protein
VGFAVVEMSGPGHQRRFERAPATSAFPPTLDILLSRSKGAGGSRRAKVVMVTPLSDRQRWGISVGNHWGITMATLH